LAAALQRRARVADGQGRDQRKGGGMTDEPLWSIFVNASLVNNFVLAYFLGLCPFLGVSGKVETATRMGGAVMFVMLISSVCAYGIHAVLTALGAPYLQLISFIVVIASVVQLVEMALKKLSPTLFRALGIFLPLITTNCAILGLALFQTNRGYGFAQCLVYALGAGSGFTLALWLMAGLREKLDLVSVPDVVRGTALTLVLAGLLSMSFMGFAGMGG
jgi:electron transport complex protein RnfA